LSVVTTSQAVAKIYTDPPLKHLRARRLANYPVHSTNSSHASSHYTLFAPHASHFAIALRASINRNNASLRWHSSS